MKGPWWELVSRGETERESAPEEWDDDGEDSFAGRGVSGGMRRKGRGEECLHGMLEAEPRTGKSCVHLKAEGGWGEAVVHWISSAQLSSAHYLCCFSI